MAELGWTYLSRKSLRQAESQLAGDAQGVRDEIGFLLLHQHFADKFFPGTSVLQTRLRYVFFITWMYQLIAARGASSSIEREIAEFEQRVCGKLVGVVPRQPGIIGGRTWPKSISQPPSTVYWNSMGVWGLLLRGEDRRVMGKTRLRLVLFRPTAGRDKVATSFQMSWKPSLSIQRFRQRQRNSLVQER